ncbi:hypothetical protein QQF64_007858 [Cirrhinus molitorella]|uniref:Uncharacterized protein n=1 Tax=Cirrhinus molitorella TaxID=172907 RepID=A0ABR3M4H5_9TELE
MESRHTDVWSRHRSSQIVTHISHSCLRVVGFRGAVIMVFLILCLNDVTIQKSKIVKHSTARDHFRHKGRAHLQSFEENRAPVCLHHTESSLNDVRECFLLKQACTGFCTGSLNGVMRQIGVLRQG